MKRIKVLVFGTFDGLHKGHLYLFMQALRQAQGKPGEAKPYLVVVVARDSTVKKVKGHLPKFNEQERLKKVYKCKYVNDAQLGNFKNYYKKIKEIKPQVICLGYDQTAFIDNLEEEIAKLKFKVEVVRLKAYNPKKYKSSLLNNK